MIVYFTGKQRTVRRACHQPDVTATFVTLALHVLLDDGLLLLLHIGHVNNTF